MGWGRLSWKNGTTCGFARENWVRMLYDAPWLEEQVTRIVNRMVRGKHLSLKHEGNGDRK
jgi:hypothetical protein